MFVPDRYEYNFQFGTGVSVLENSVQQIMQFQYDPIIQPTYFLLTAQKIGAGVAEAYFEFFNLSSNTLIARIPATGTEILPVAPKNYETTTLLSIISGPISIGVVVTVLKQGPSKSSANILSVYVR